MTRSWLRSVAYHVALVFTLAFLASLLSAPAGIAHLSTLHAAAIAGLGAGAAALYASLGQLQRGAVATARAVTRAASRVAGLHTAHDAAGINSSSTPRLHIGLVAQTRRAKVGYGDLAKWLPALHQQVAEFAAAWGQRRPLVSIYASATRALAAGVDLLITVLDDSDQADALGYHDETDVGIPYARVFALDCEKYGVAVSSCVSHELLEAIADLSCARWAQAADGRLWALEVCDPVEADTYDVDGVEMSNYVTPAFFDPHGTGPYDALGKLTKPFTMTGGGYGIVMDGGKVSQVYGSKKAAAGKKLWDAATKRSRLSRTARRLNRT